jgi:hypothetical protein
MLVVSFMSRTLYTPERTPVSIEYEAVWTAEPGWVFWRKVFVTTGV